MLTEVAIAAVAASKVVVTGCHGSGDANVIGGQTHPHLYFYVPDSVLGLCKLEAIE
jgi:hypothetical protein